MLGKQKEIQGTTQRGSKTICQRILWKKEGRTEWETNVKTERPLCKCMVRKYTMSRHEQSIKHQIKLKGQGQPKVIRHGDDETGIMGIWNQTQTIKPYQPQQLSLSSEPNIDSESCPLKPLPETQTKIIKTKEHTLNINIKSIHNKQHTNIHALKPPNIHSFPGFQQFRWISR